MDDSFDWSAWLGFKTPRYTPIPDDFFDVVAPRLNEGELRVVLYVMRRTFGFKKDADTISLNQMLNGIVTQDGRRLDSGTGLSKSVLLRSLRTLTEKGILLSMRRQDERGGNAPTLYRLRLDEGEGGRTATGPRVVPVPDLGVGPLPVHTRNSNTRNSEQETENTLREAQPPFDSDYQTLETYMSDFGREMRDRSPLKVSTARLVKIYRASGLELEPFVERMQEARRITKLQTAQVRGQQGRKSLVAYWFGVLEGLIQ